MRIALGLSMLILTAFAPFAGGPVEYHSIRIVPSLLVPTLVPMIAFVVLFDMLMTRVFMVEKSGHERTRLKRILWFESGLLAVLIIAWWSFFSGLLTR